MLVEAGMIPKNAIELLSHFCLIPQDYVQSHGTTPLDTSKSEDVEEFIGRLGAAVTRDMAEMKETQFDVSGGFKEVAVCSNGWHYHRPVLVDKLGRLLVPNSVKWRHSTKVAFEGDDKEYEIIRKEERHKGDRVISLVIYLSSWKGDRNVSNASDH